MVHPALKRLIASLLSAALILLSPGQDAYRAFAASPVAPRTPAVLSPWAPALRVFAKIPENRLAGSPGLAWLRTADFNSPRGLQLTQTIAARLEAAGLKPEDFAGPATPEQDKALLVAVSAIDASLREERSQRAQTAVETAAVSWEASATIPLVDLLSNDDSARTLLDSLPEGPLVDVRRFRRLARAIYLYPPDQAGSVSLASVRRGVERRGSKEADRALLRALTDLPRLTAEGMARARVHAPSSSQLDKLQKAWPRDDKGSAIADVIVIGAGPAGLATGLHAAHTGLKTIVFEAGYAAQSFSDAAMKPIYRMRTPTERNSLAQAPFSPPELVKSLGLSSRLHEYRSRGQAADSALYAQTRAPPLGQARSGLDTDDPAIASARNELLQHYADASEALIQRGGIMAERTRVESVKKGTDGLWTVIANGRVQRARKLVLAQGQVGTDIEHARFPADLEIAATDAGLEPLVLKEPRDLARENAPLDDLLRSLRADRAPSRRLMINDTLLGSAPIERTFRLQPAGTRVMVVGSGESAVKAAVAVLRLNPKLSVDLFVKDRLRAAQLQIPPEHAQPDHIARAMKDPALAAQSIDEWMRLGTPVTPATLSDLQKLREAGRLRIIPMGKKCVACTKNRPNAERTVEFERERRGGRDIIKVYAADPAVEENLRAEGLGQADPKAGRWLIAEIDGPVVAAVGYSRASLRQDPITRALEAQGRLKQKGGTGKASAAEFELASNDPLRSAQDPDLYLVGAQNLFLSADSAIPGAVARAAATVEHIVETLKAPRGPPALDSAKASTKAAKQSSPSQSWALYTVAATAVLATLALGPTATVAYYVSNALSFVFLIPQIHKILDHRSAHISAGTAAIGVAAAALSGINFAFDDKPLMVYRNVAQVLGFAAVLAATAWYGSRSAPERPSRVPTWVKTTGAVAGLAVMTAAIGAGLLTILPGAAWLAPLVLMIQIGTGLGYAYLLVPQVRKLAAEQTNGDASIASVGGFLGTRMIAVWTFATLAAIPVAGASTLPLLALYPAAFLPAAYLLLRRIVDKKWSAKASFAALAALFALSVPLAYLFFSNFLVLPADGSQRFLLYLFYLTHNLMAAAASLLTLNWLQKNRKSGNSAEPKN